MCWIVRLCSGLSTGVARVIGDLVGYGEDIASGRGMVKEVLSCGKKSMSGVPGSNFRARSWPTNGTITAMSSQ